MAKPKQVINVSVLPNQPVDGGGRVCIHLFVPDERGPFIEPHALHPATNEQGVLVGGQFIAKPTRGRLACDHRRTVAPVKRFDANGRRTITAVTLRTDDARAVTCPKCMASEYYTRTVEAPGVTSEVR